MKIKKALLYGLSFVLVAAVAIGGTLAYLTSEDSDVNVMTLGNVKIEQNEYQRVQNADGTYPTKTIDGKTSYILEDFTNDKPLYPIVGDPNEPGNSPAYAGYDDITVRMTQVGSYGGMQVFAGKNAQDKFVTVKNTGKTDAFVRTYVAIEIGSTDGKLIMTSSRAQTADATGTQPWIVSSVGTIEIDDNNYKVVEYVYRGASDVNRHVNGILPAGDTTYPNLCQVYLKHNATNEDMVAIDGNGNGKLDILVFSQAVQAAGFENADEAFENSRTGVTPSAAEIALDTAFGTPEVDTDGGDVAIWFGGIKSANFVPANAVKIDSTITHDDFAALLAAGKNIYLTESVTIANPESSRFTEFDVNGEVGIWAAEGATLTFGETTGITGEGVLTVYSGSVDEKQELWVGATLVFEGGEHTFAALSVSGDGKIVVNDGTLNCKGTYAGIMGITFGENGNLVVNGGKINLYQPINLNPNRCDAAYVEINGGTVELLNGIENLFVVRNVMDKDKAAGGVLRGSSVRITGGTFIAHYEIDSAGDATSFIRNGDSPADGNKVLVSNADKYDCVVTGGTFYGSWQRADNMRYTDGNDGYSDGKMVDNSVAGFVVNGYKITGDATNGYVVSAN